MSDLVSDSGYAQVVKASTTTITTTDIFVLTLCQCEHNLETF